MKRPQKVGQKTFGVQFREASAQFIFFAKVLPDSNSSQYGLWDAFWEGLARRPLGKANNKPTDNRHYC